ncbi:MAG: hypothetical protein ACO3MV_09275, partial [Flavobacteriales bacterium]
MQNKNAILLFTILLALATVYTLSLSVVSSNLEEAADKYGVYVADSLLTKGEITNEDSAATQNAAAREYLRATANVWSLPLIPSLYSI